MHKPSSEESAGVTEPLGQPAWFRVLSFYFGLRWNRADLGDRAARVWSDFRVDRDPDEDTNPPTPGNPPVYDVVDAGEGGSSPRFEIYFGQGLLARSDQPESVLRTLAWHVNSEAIRRTGDFLLVHAGSVTTPSGEGVLMPGASGAGKTTLVAGMVSNGFGYLSDEAGAIDPVTRLLYPYAKPLSFKTAEALSLFPQLRGSSPPRGAVESVLPDELRAGAIAGPSPIRYVIYPRYDRMSGTTLSSLKAGEGAFELGRSILNLKVYGRRALPIVRDVARDARFFRLVFGDLARAINVVSEALQAGA